MLKNYGIVYAQSCLPEDHFMSWMKWCNMPAILPAEFKAELEAVVKKLNEKWADDIYLPINASPMPTCLCKPEVAEEIAKDIHKEFNLFLSPYSEEKHNMRVVWTTGEMNDEVEYSTSAHGLGSHKPAVRIGLFLQSKSDCGVFRV
jgi:hypothetical protein